MVRPQRPHASCPGGIDPTSPGPNSASEPSSIRTTIRPEVTWMRWPTWQLSVPIAGLTHSDQRHPGSLDHARDLDTTQVHELDLALVKGPCFFHGSAFNTEYVLPYEFLGDDKIA